MHSLVLTIVSIGLLAAMLAATVNYLPYWSKDAAITESLVSSGFVELERAFELQASLNGDIPAPVVTSADDGGLANNFISLLGFVPQPPVGYRWVYGQHVSDATRYSDMYYFCLMPTQSGVTPKGRELGISRFKAQAGIDQYVLSDHCGASVDLGTPGNISLHATYYVLYTPGM
jgi:hypothetical protein